MAILQFSGSQSPEPTGPADYLTAVIVFLSVVYLSVLSAYAVYNYIHREEPERNELNKKHPKALVLSSMAGCVWIVTLLVTHDHFDFLESAKNSACIVWTLYLEQFLGLSVLLTTNNMRLFYYYTILGGGGSEYTTMGWHCIFKGKEIMFALLLLLPMFLLCIFTTLFDGVRYDSESGQCIADPAVRILVIMYIIIQFLFFVALSIFNHLTISWDVISEKRATIVYIVLVCILGALIIPIKVTSEINDRDGRVIATLASVMVVVSFHTMMIGRTFFSKFFKCCRRDTSDIREYSLLEMNAPIGGGNANKLIKDDMALAYVLTKSRRFDLDINLSDFDMESSSSSIIPFYDSSLESWDKIQNKVSIVIHFLRFLYNENIEIKRKRVLYTPQRNESKKKKGTSDSERDSVSVGDKEDIKTERVIDDCSDSESDAVSYRLNKLIGGEHVSKEFRTNNPIITDLLKNGSKDFFVGLDMYDDEIVVNYSMNIAFMYIEMCVMKTQIEQLFVEVSEAEKKISVKTDNDFTSTYMNNVKLQMYRKYFPMFKDNFERCMLVYVFRPQDIVDGYDRANTKLRVNFDKETFNTIVFVYKILTEVLKENTEDDLFLLTDLISYGVNVLRNWCDDKFRRILYPIYSSKDTKNGLSKFINDDSLRATIFGVMRSEGLLSSRGPEIRMTKLSSAYDLVRVEGNDNNRKTVYVNTHKEKDEEEKEREGGEITDEPGGSKKDE